MDFSNRSAQSQPAAPVVPTAAGSSSTSKKTKQSDDSKWGRIGFVAGIVIIVVLLLGVIVAVAKSSSAGTSEATLVDSSKLQAVFLNTGQVYFGNVKTLNNKYFVVSNIYYLQTASSGSSTTTTNANTSVSLVKLGCELHEPYDKMVINRDQVTFWENLQDGGQVAKAVTTFEKQNPNGQKCAEQSSSSSNTSNSVQNANNGSTTTTPTTTTKKP
jgi:hypothetical protein